MSIEQYANAAATTIAEDLDDSETGVDVASAALFPAAGNFRVLVDSELMIVTGVSGTTFTVVRGAEGTTAAAHSSGATLTQILTRDSHRAVLSHLFGGGFREVIHEADFAWINQGAASVSTDGFSLCIKAPYAAGEQVRLLKQTAPSPPYTLTAVLSATFFPTNYQSFGLMWRSSANGYLTSFSLNNEGRFMAYKWTAPSTYSAAYNTGSYNSIVVRAPNQFVTMRLSDDNTNRKWYLSDNGYSWIEVFSVGRTDFHTPDEIGFYCNGAGAAATMQVTLRAWELA